MSREDDFISELVRICARACPVTATDGAPSSFIGGRRTAVAASISESTRSGQQNSREATQREW